MHFTLNAYFELHFRQFYQGSILYGPWLDCFHQQTDLGPYWVTLSGGIRDIAWRQILKWNKQLMISLEIVDTSQGDRMMIVSSPWDYRRMTVRCPYDFMGPAKASCGDLAGSLRLSQESTIIFGPKWQSKTLRCPHDHHAVAVRIVRCHCDVSTGLWFFSKLSLCGVKQNRRGHDARKSVRWSQGLPAEAVRKRWFGHRTGIVYSSYGKCNRGMNSMKKIQGFFETLKIMPFQNLHRRSQSKGTFISKSYTFHCYIKYSSDMLSIYNWISLKL